MRACGPVAAWLRCAKGLSKKALHDPPQLISCFQAS